MSSQAFVLTLVEFDFDVNPHGTGKQAWKPFYGLVFVVVEPKPVAGNRFSARLDCSAKPLWKLNKSAPTGRRLSPPKRLTKKPGITPGFFRNAGKSHPL
jgi:hypothetical protein